VETSGLMNSRGGAGLTTAEMMDPDMLGLNGLGGDPNWVLDSGRDYPRLNWEERPGLIIPQPVIDWLDGTGKPEDPFQIENADQLLLLHKSSMLCNKHFVLNADIDLDPSLPGRIVFRRAVILTFKGSFVGNGHAILNLQIEGVDHLGFFGTLSKGSLVRNLGLENVLVHGTGSDIGGLVGYMGYNSSGQVLNCYSTGSASGENRVGGLVGAIWTTNLEVINCYSTGRVSGNEDVGGLVGEISTFGLPNFPEDIRDIVINCYSTVTVSGNEDVGGLVGRVHRPGMAPDPGFTPWTPGLILSKGVSVTSCFWDIQTSGQATSAGGTGKTTAEMQTAGTFLEAGWDFVDETANGTEGIWWILEGQDYPRLWWQPEVDVVEQVSLPLRGESGEMILGLGRLLTAVYSYSPDGKYIATAGSLGAFLWDAETGALLRTIRGHTDWVMSVAFSPDGKRVLMGSDDGIARLWDAETGQEIRTFLGHRSYVLSVAFSPDGTRVLTWSSLEDNTAKLWDVETGQEIRTFLGHTSSVTSVAFSPDGTQVLTGSGDGTARIWELVQPEPPQPPGPF